jgi:hypothetical protein
MSHPGPNIPLHLTFRYRSFAPLLRQQDLSRLGSSITFEQFSEKMFDIITANQFYDRRFWSPGPLGHRDPVFQNIMFAPWAMVDAHALTFHL